MALTAEEIKAYREKHGCSLQEAHRVLKRLDLFKDMEHSRTLESLKETLIEILNFEFGGYSNG